MKSLAGKEPIPGTTIFEGRMAMKGYALNKMCFSFNKAENREAFKADEDAYCVKYDLSDAQRAAVKKRDVLALLNLGGNIYYLAKLTGMFGLNMQDIGAQQAGISLEKFKAKLLAAGETKNG